MLMIYVDVCYQKKNGDINQFTKTFNTVNKAIRFIYKINRLPNYSYNGFSTDDEEELYEMNNKL